ncbi:MAG: hypothetical protein IK081_13270 [Lachnospiraceae bacterium]|nr:hypothetical protein [Lachnospiraceae bacterium]
MKKVRGYVIIGVIVVVIVCLVNWDYIYKLVNLESRAISEIFSGKNMASRELNDELDDMTVWKFLNPKLVALIPQVDSPTLPDPDPLPTQSPEPKNRPYEDVDKDEIREILKTEPNTAYFWSGTTTAKNGEIKYSKEVARALAEKNGGVTLEMLLDENHIDMPDWGDGPASEKAWEEVSKMFAEQASGKVWAVIGRDVRDDNIWENREYVILDGNDDVEKITLIEPLSEEEKILLER